MWNRCSNHIYDLPLSLIPSCLPLCLVYNPYLLNHIYIIILKLLTTLTPPITPTATTPSSLPLHHQFETHILFFKNTPYATKCNYTLPHTTTVTTHPYKNRQYAIVLIPISSKNNPCVKLLRQPHHHFQSPLLCQYSTTNNTRVSPH